MDVNSKAQDTTNVENRRRDAGSKSIFRDKNLIAEMLIGITEEFRDMKREDVIKCLCLDPVDGSVKDLNSELALDDAGSARLDTLIEAVVPGTDDKVMVSSTWNAREDSTPDMTSTIVLNITQVC